MHVDNFDILTYRIRRLEILQELMADARRCSSIYAQAALVRGMYERLLEEHVARKSIPAFLLLLIKHHDQDLKILRRTLAYAAAENQPVIDSHIAATQQLRSTLVRRAAAIANLKPAHSPERRMYEQLQKSTTIETVAAAVYDPLTFRRFYADYASLCPFVHGGNRETLIVTKSRGDLSSMLRQLVATTLAAFETEVSEYLEELRAAAR